MTGRDNSLEVPGTKTERSTEAHQAWVRDGHAHIEIRGGRQGLVTAEHGTRLEQALETVDGVHWAAWNGMLGRLVVSYDQATLASNDLMNAVAQAECEHIPLDLTTGPSDGPSDVGFVVGDTVALAA